MIALGWVFIFAKSAKAFYSSSTFEARKAAYINDRGNYWESRYAGQDNNHWYIQAVWSWLESGLYPDRIHDVVTWLSDTSMNAGQSSCPDSWGAFPGCADHPGYTRAMRMLLQYGNKLSTADYQVLKNSLGPDTNTDVSFANMNYAFTHTIPNYLWFKYFDPQKQIQATWRSTYNYPGNFSYNGHTYISGQNYPAFDLYRDNALYLIDRMVHSGDAEWNSEAYSYTVIRSLLLLYDFAQSGSNDSEGAEVKRRAKMGLDMLLAEAGAEFSANQWGGTTGRSYSADYCGNRTQMPWGILWDLPGTVTRAYAPSTDQYMTTYRMPANIEDLVQLEDEPDNYWHLVTGNLNYGSEWGRFIYTYVTKFFNLGGVPGPWKLNILDSSGFGTPFRLWITDIQDSCSSTNIATQGGTGYQNKNILLNSQYSASNYVVVKIPSQGWDEASQESGWNFYREGKTAIAIGGAGSNKTGMEIVLIGSGLDYATYFDFKNAVKSSARISGSTLFSSKGQTVSEGFIDGNPNSFPRLRVTDYRGNRLIDWSSNTATISKNGHSCTYDFNSWNYSGDCGGGGGGGPTPTAWPTSSPPFPTNTPQPTPIATPGDLDHDGDVDIFDYNILITNFGNTNCGNIADISPPAGGDCKVDIFDYNQVVENFGRKVSPVPISQSTFTPTPGGEILCTQCSDQTPCATPCEVYEQIHTCGEAWAGWRGNSCPEF